MVRRRVFQFIQIALTIALFGFVALKAQDFLEQVEWSAIPAVWMHVVASGIFFALGFATLSQHWLLVAREIVPKVTGRQRLAFFASQPYKYLPTSFFTLSFRAFYAKKLGMSLADSSKAQVIENINIITSAFLVASIAWLFYVSVLYGSLGMVVLIVLLGVLWRNHHIKTSIYKIKLVLHMRCWVKAFLLSSCAWLLVGLGFFSLATGLQSETAFLNAITATGYAFGAGILAVFAPGGIGVREVIFSSFGFVASTVIVWRCITFVIDIVLGVISIFLIRRSR